MLHGGLMVWIALAGLVAMKKITRLNKSLKIEYGPRGSVGNRRKIVRELCAQAHCLCLPPQYQVELAQLASRQLQVSVWHLGVLTRRVFLGEVIVPLATWDFEDKESQSFRWYPLRAKVSLKASLVAQMVKNLPAMQEMQV